MPKDIKSDGELFEGPFQKTISTLKNGLVIIMNQLYSSVWRSN